MSLVDPASESSFRVSNGVGGRAYDQWSTMCIRKLRAIPVKSSVGKSTGGHQCWAGSGTGTGSRHEAMGDKKPLKDKIDV